MKKYNRIIAVVVLIYILIAVGSGLLMHKIKIEHNGFYKVEINRILSGLANETDLKRLSLSEFEQVKAVKYLPATERNQSAVEAFYQPENRLTFEIRPWYTPDGTFKGYLRFEYFISQSDTMRIILLVQLFLGIMALFITGVLFYIKFTIITPFNKLRTVPYELAEGHLKGEIKEEKSGYFGQFLWGMGQLRDNLDSAKGRQLQLEKEKKQMLLSLSHEIKTPLNTIGLYGKALEEDIYKTDYDKKCAAHKIGDKVKEIEGYIEEIMKASKEDILDITVNMEEFYLADLINSVRSVYTEKCKIRHIQLNIQDFDNRLLKGDIHRMQEVLENILENALKYGDGQQIEISFYEEEYRQLIRVFNTGKPVTEHELNHIFESFFRGSNSKGKKGSGLGLYICRETMHKMGGDIFAYSGAEGMTFVLVFQ